MIDHSWALFADWCSATDRQCLPAERETAEQFLVDLPCSPVTAERRLLSIRRHHFALGLPDPLPPAVPPRQAVDQAVGRILAATAVYGWPGGLRGRRDGFLLALRGYLQLSRPAVRELLPNDIEVGAGWARIGTDRLSATDSPGECPVCAITGWCRLLSLAQVRGWSAARNQLAAVFQSTAGDRTEHDCARSVPSAWTRSAALLPAIDQFGNVDERTALSTRAMSAIALSGRATIASAEHPSPSDSAPASLGPSTRWDRRKANAVTLELDSILDVLDSEIEQVASAIDALLAVSARKPTRQAQKPEGQPLTCTNAYPVFDGLLTPPGWRWPRRGWC